MKALSIGITLFLGLLISYPTLFSSGFHTLPGDPGDSRLNHFILEYGYLWVSQKSQPFSFWNPPIFFPVKNTMAYSDNLLGAAPIYWLYRLLGLASERSMQFWMLTVSGLNFLFFYYWIRQGLLLNRIASVAGAFLYAFSASRIASLVHSQLLPVFYVPIIATALVRLFTNYASPKSRRGWEAVFFGSWLAQLYAGFYMGWFLSLGIGIAFILSISHKQTRIKLLSILRKDFIYIGFFLMLFLAALYPMGIHYFRVASELGQRTLDQIREPKLQSWLYLGGGSWLYRWQEKVRAFQVIQSHEQQIGIGWITLSISLCGLYLLRKRRSIGILGRIFFVCFVCVTSFYKNGTLWHFIFPWLPGAGAIRALSRIGLAALFPLATGFAGWIHQAKIHKKHLATLLSFCFLEQLRSIPFYNTVETQQKVESIGLQISSNCQSFIVGSVNSEFSSPTFPELSLYAMWASIQNPLKKIVPTLNGYSGNAPKNWPGAQLSPLQMTLLHSWIAKHSLDLNHTCVILPPNP